MVRGIFGFCDTHAKGLSHFGHIPHCHSALAHADRRENFTVEARSAEHFRDEPVSLFDFALSADELAALERINQQPGYKVTYRSRAQTLDLEPENA